ncbi:inactive peptidyl-prolyl cis-trans isomerase FKBP6 isoform X3 [Oncorhynchus tshawytscha]|uniref:inactive peptidyl-prolyl cis-trans isomerase FKBP6 isoform X3 n=1 Tax=Oncorhynchus tshawytscha TaxID=74940 RepID=UPI001C3C7B47|nr:inactive peptidyl-prolyl cis-trans isomerase FKBP6 isoform X3 [Oncorhynchus tshawytscha]
MMSANGLSTRIQQFLDPHALAHTPSPFHRLGQQMQDILGDGGILKEVVQPGEGPPVPRDSSVSIHFSGFLEYSDRPFETTSHLKYPRMMKLGRDVTLCGLELGILTMRKGEFSRFLFLPEYAYGAMGCPPLIPPVATVLYEVQVLDFLDSAEVDEFFAMSPVMHLCLLGISCDFVGCRSQTHLFRQEEQNTAPLSMLLNVVDTERSFGNRCFNHSRFEDAKDRYKQAVTLLGNRKAEDEEEKRSIVAGQLPIYLNLSLTQLRLDRPLKALEYGHKALKIDPNNTKALFRCGQVRPSGRGEFIFIHYKDCLDKEKELCSKMFADFVKK